MRLLLYQPLPTEPPIAASATVVFDPGTYRELFQDAEPEGRAWLEDYLDAAAALLQRISTAALTDAREDLRAAAHRLAGVSLSAGAMVFGTLCRELETAAPNAPATEIERLLDAAQDAFSSARREIMHLIRMEPAVAP